MKFLFQICVTLLLVAGVTTLVPLSLENRDLRNQIDRLEAELGRLPIQDADRVHVVEIESPSVPPEVASHLERVWQFRCYLPPNYDVIRFSGSGRVAADGLYQSGGAGSGWGSPRPEATHKLLTVSFQKQADRWEVFNAFGGSSGSSSWQRFEPERIDQAVVVEKIVDSQHGPRSFDRETILPILKIYDPASAEDEQVVDRTLTTYSGGLLVLCPKSREQDFSELRRGVTPDNFDSAWIAAEAHNE